MAIQTINLTVPGGDTPRSANVKINHNFSNTRHAASKLIDVGLDDMSVNADILKNGISRQNIPVYTTSTLGDLDIAKIALGESVYVASTGAANSPPTSRYVVHTQKNHNTFLRVRQTAYDYFSTDIYTQVTDDAGIVQYEWAKLLSDKNSKLDTNGSWSPSSPTIDLYSDHIEYNADAEKMNPEFIRNGVGDYTIKNTTGLRENDGWYIKIPNDRYGNPKVMADIEQLENGDINIKTYGRKFDFEFAGVVPDLDNPQDIPEGRWIDLRLNEIPVEEENL